MKLRYHYLLLGLFIILGLFLMGCSNNVNPTSTGNTDTVSENLVTQSGQDSELPVITMEELSAHNTADDCWQVIHGKVYDFTDYIASGEHVPDIIKGCGIDATSLFDNEKKHSKPIVAQLLNQYQVGKIE